jgi:hypothetical protein
MLGIWAKRSEGVRGPLNRSRLVAALLGLNKV